MVPAAASERPSGSDAGPRHRFECRPIAHSGAAMQLAATAVAAQPLVAVRGQHEPPQSGDGPPPIIGGAVQVVMRLRGWSRTLEGQASEGRGSDSECGF